MRYRVDTDAVLAEPAASAADLLVVTGDHASGPQLAEVVERLSGPGSRAGLLRENADRELSALARGMRIDVPDDVSPWAAAQADAATCGRAERNAGDRHPAGRRRRFRAVLSCDATGHQEIVLVDSRLPRWQEVFATVPASVTTVDCGHTHMPFTRLVDRRLVANSGSVGKPYGQPGGPWALLRSGNLTLGRTLVDTENAIREVVARSAHPGRRESAEYRERPAGGRGRPPQTISPGALVVASCGVSCRTAHPV